MHDAWVCIHIQCTTTDFIQFIKMAIFILVYPLTALGLFSQSISCFETWQYIALLYSTVVLRLSYPFAFSLAIFWTKCLINGCFFLLFPGKIKYK